MDANGVVEFDDQGYVPNFNQQVQDLLFKFNEQLFAQ